MCLFKLKTNFYFKFMLSSIDSKTIKLNNKIIYAIDDKGFHPFPIFAPILSGHSWEALKKGQGITISSFLYFLLFMLKDPPIISFVNSFRRFRRGFSDIYKKCWINQVETRASDSNLNGNLNGFDPGGCFVHCGICIFGRVSTFFFTRRNFSPAVHTFHLMHFILREDCALCNFC